MLEIACSRVWGENEVQMARSFCCELAELNIEKERILKNFMNLSRSSEAMGSGIDMVTALIAEDISQARAAIIMSGNGASAIAQKTLLQTRDSAIASGVSTERADIWLSGPGAAAIAQKSLVQTCDSAIASGVSTGRADIMMSGNGASAIAQKSLVQTHTDIIADGTDKRRAGIMLSGPGASASAQKTIVMSKNSYVSEGMTKDDAEKALSNNGGSASSQRIYPETRVNFKGLGFNDLQTTALTKGVHGGAKAQVLVLTCATRLKKHFDLDEIAYEILTGNNNTNRDIIQAITDICIEKAEEGIPKAEIIALVAPGRSGIKRRDTANKYMKDKKENKLNIIYIIL